MEDCGILLTGDYLHSDFQELIREDHNSITLTPFANLIATSIADKEFSVIVIAQSRRNQFDSSDLEAVAAKCPHLPIITLSGSWCEGEMRSGRPCPGLIRIYWHQWQGRLKNFRWQLLNRNISTWHLPKTYSSADRIIADSQRPTIGFPGDALIGISALAPEAFSMLQDVCRSAGLKSVWIDATPEGEGHVGLPQIVLINGNSMNNRLVARIKSIKSQHPDAQLILFLNFPRQFDLGVAKAEGIQHVISKPFYLRDLHLLMSECFTTSRAA